MISKNVVGCNDVSCDKCIRYPSRNNLRILEFLKTSHPRLGEQSSANAIPREIFQNIHSFLIKYSYIFPDVFGIVSTMLASLRVDRHERGNTPRCYLIGLEDLKMYYSRYTGESFVYTVCLCILLNYDIDITYYGDTLKDTDVIDKLLRSYHIDFRRYSYECYSESASATLLTTVFCIGKRQILMVPRYAIYKEQDCHEMVHVFGYSRPLGHEQGLIFYYNPHGYLLDLQLTTQRCIEMLFDFNEPREDHEIKRMTIDNAPISKRQRLCYIPNDYTEPYRTIFASDEPCEYFKK